MLFFKEEETNEIEERNRSNREVIPLTAQDREKTFLDEFAKFSNNNKTHLQFSEKMKVFSIILYRCFGQNLPIHLASVFELSSFGYFQRGSVKELANFVSREVVCISIR